MANAAFIRSESRRSSAECPMVSRLQRSTSRQTQLRFRPVRTYVRSPTTWARGACPSKRLSSRFGSGAPFGFEAECWCFVLEYALTRPFFIIIREMRLPDATMARLSSGRGRRALRKW